MSTLLDLGSQWQPRLPIVQSQRATVHRRRKHQYTPREIVTDRPTGKSDSLLHAGNISSHSIANVEFCELNLQECDQRISYRERCAIIKEKRSSFEREITKNEPGLFSRDDTCHTRNCWKVKTANENSRSRKQDRFQDSMNQNVVFPVPPSRKQKKFRGRGIFGNIEGNQSSSTDSSSRIHRVNVSDMPRSNSPLEAHDPDKLNFNHVIDFLQSQTRRQINTPLPDTKGSSPVFPSAAMNLALKSPKTPRAKHRPDSPSTRSSNRDMVSNWFVRPISSGCADKVHPNRRVIALCRTPETRFDDEVMTSSKRFIPCDSQATQCLSHRGKTDIKLAMNSYSNSPRNNGFHQKTIRHRSQAVNKTSNVPGIASQNLLSKSMPNLPTTVDLESCVRSNQPNGNMNKLSADAYSLLEKYKLGTQKTVLYYEIQTNLDLLASANGYVKRNSPLTRYRKRGQNESTTQLEIMLPMMSGGSDADSDCMSMDSAHEGSCTQSRASPDLIRTRPSSEIRQASSNWTKNDSNREHSTKTPEALRLSLQRDRLLLKRERMDV